MTVAIYMRLSSEDRDLFGEKTESNSIVNQREYLKNYIRGQIDLCNAELAEYCDDGFSGLNFERPAMQRMLKDAEKGEIQVIIVKDFSRFVRNYLMAGEYLERQFPLWNVRFISINDYYDSKIKNAVAVENGIANLAYELYSRDISIKIKQGKKLSMQKGYYVGSIPPYGYQKDTHNKHKLIIDETAAKVVRCIFQWKADGKSARQIALQLNDEHILPPAVHLKMTKNQDETKYCWDSASINRMIKNQCYIGNMVGHKRVTPRLNEKRIQLPVSDQIIVENTHKGIISKELFFQANLQNKCLPKKQYQKKKHTLQGLLICGGCGKKLTYRVKNQSTNPMYFCRMALLSTKNNCFTGVISSQSCVDMISYIGEILIGNFGNSLCVMQNKMDNQIDKELSVQKKLERNYNNRKQKKLELFEKYCLEEITEELYIQQKEKVENEILELENQRAVLLSEKINSKTIESFFVFDIGMIPILLNKVIVFHVDCMELQFAFKDLFV